LSDVSFTAPTFSDNCGATITPVVLDTVTNGPACNATVTRRWTGTDPCNNSTTNSASVLVQDTTAPVVVTPAAGNGPVQCLSDVSFTAPTFSDNCGATITPVVLDTVTNGPACNATVTRRWTGTDPCNNSTTNSASVLVQDTTAPVVVNARRRQRPGAMLERREFHRPDFQRQLRGDHHPGRARHGDQRPGLQRHRHPPLDRHRSVQ